MPTQEEKIEEGRKAFRKIRGAAETAWEDWEPVIVALKIGSDWAARKAEIPQGQERNGKKYSNAFSEWLKEHKWSQQQGGPGKTTRAACLKCANDLAAIRKHRQAMFEEDPDKALLLNHPQKVWSSFTSKNPDKKPEKQKKPVDLAKLADTIADLDVEQVCTVLHDACTEKAMTFIVNDLDKALEKKTVKVERRSDPAKLAEQLAFELDWSPSQVEKVIATLQKWHQNRTQKPVAETPAETPEPPPVAETPAAETVEQAEAAE